MWKRNFSLFMIFSLIGFSAVAQGKIEFEKTSHDFGTLQEENGVADVTFSFKNIGTKPIKLTDVKASCGCTTPDWTQNEVAPGETGYVKASYNTRNRPGKFNKTVSVRVKTDEDPDSSPQLFVLRISGDVTPRPKGPSDWYPMESGNLRFKTSHIVFGDVMHNGADTASTVIFNQGKTPITIDLANTTLPKHITASINQTTIEPGKTAILSFSYNAAEKSDWGYNFEYFNLKTDDTEQAEKRINLSASIRENFGERVVGEKLAKVKFDKLKHNFGLIKQQDRVSTSFTITNEGDAPLFIRKTKASCGCTASKPKKMQLAPGESTNIDVTFSSGSRTGKQKKSITVITNDPNQDVTTLWIESEVEKPVEK